MTTLPLQRLQWSKCKTLKDFAYSSDYSPDLAPSESYLFPNLTQYLGGHTFKDDNMETVMK
jgi:hypothetical protein